MQLLIESVLDEPNPLVTEKKSVLTNNASKKHLPCNVHKPLVLKTEIKNRQSTLLSRTSRSHIGEIACDEISYNTRN